MFFANLKIDHTFLTVKLIRQHLQAGGDINPKII